MEFSGQYLTYEEYKAIGGTLDQTPFNLLEFEARKKIDERTQCRLKNLTSDEIPREVKLCVNALIKCLTSYSESSENKSVASESTDGYSISYITGGQLRESVIAKKVELDDIITTYLINVVVNNVHVLYLGVK